MLGHHVCRVHPNGEEWKVIKEGEDRARANFDDREQAIAEAMHAPISRRKSGSTTAMDRLPKNG